MLRSVVTAVLMAAALLTYRPAGLAAPPYHEQDFLTRVRRLTVEGRRAGEGYWSPDGGRLVFQRARTGQSLLPDLRDGPRQRRDEPRLDGNRQDDVGVLPPRHRPDRVRLDPCRSEIPAKLGFENFELFIVDTAGTKEPVQVTYSPGFDGLPVPSPDGRTLAWTSSRAGGSAGQIFLGQWNHEAAMAALASAPARKPAAKS